ncbi:hypothetical protein PHYBLDRAFT_149704 [Phycomyces blakesleeanus NRRL 1555(-)]|uniref:DDE Tnp4 domain-containing protein n=1 Tax=Phycomyces blakesleeanus (strain ATCC 8743b / DSM 1359 / FGSC 10004 / NBRC 33097 / NRRL 1555) TaxID=763407 RepID=A0A162WNL8_PHYB8|nr:hypothetical protein PHYBLDRAFT_149704 [Phycomyces blakesleeanus NRRL 1555(-)]OAD69305.1 hypothetical protein PHYBLDRAFT_149704 [Phycomyces blakesleeanus NRRL 1555(-)]|eukprot:XP_018287345.1 hypothetical protein PHYBLDRAFT_149704 [Phycomyces blakesleeanus NRRL 1555(-)]
MSRFDPIIELTDRYINHSSRRIAEEQERGWVSVPEQQEEHADVYEDQEPTNEEIQEALAQYARDREQEGERIAVSLHCQGCLDPSTLSDEDSKLLFRFTQPEIRSLATLLEMGDIVYFREGTPSEFSLPMTLALMIVLRRMVFPARLVDLSLLFGKGKSTLSVIFNEMIEKIYIKFYPALKFDYCQFRESNQMCFSRAIREKSPAMYCVGFIDGTFNKIARPIVDQEGAYNGHYRGHGLKYQAVVTPDGVTSSIMGPDSGRNHDVRMYRESQLDAMMCVAFDFTSINGPCYYLYGDPAYTASDHMMIPFRRQTADEQELAINKSMSAVRISVEHEFAHVGSLWAFLKYSQTQRSGQSPVGLYYIVGTFLKNLHVCYNGGNQTSKKYGVAPPTPEQYIYGLLNQ